MDPENRDLDLPSNGPQKDGGSGEDCDVLRALLPAYSLGATDAEETLLVESLLPGCPEAAVEHAAYEELAERLLFSATPTKAPSFLRDRVLAAIRLPSGRQSASPSDDFELQSTQPGLASYHGRLWLARAMATILLLALSNLYWSAQIRALQDTQRETTRLLEDHTDVLALIGAGEVHRFELVSPDDNTVLAVMVCDWEERVGFIYAEALPPLSPNRVYQVWLVRDQVRVSAGTFVVDENGEGVLIFRTDQPMGYYESAEITLEEIGTIQPTTPALARELLSY